METDFVADTSHPVTPGAPFQLKIANETKTPRVHQSHFVALSRGATVSAWALSRSRRVIDFLVAVLALTVFLPLMGFVAIAVRLSSSGPVLFQQERMGRNDAVFTLYKFRSMRLAADQFSPITVSGDNRITPIGKLLRKYKLDELPQFWNVLRGDMSLVGPRPKLPHHEGLHMPFRPGITGAATLAFRFEEELLSQIPRQHLDSYYEKFVKPRKARIDWEYMRSATFRSDIGILWQTAKSCVSGEGTIYRLDMPEFSEAVQEAERQQTGAAPEPALSVRVI
jgi:lipopolysaccharide/colanic/teichoic acid biosynthesis glycosyltransferase